VIQKTNLPEKQIIEQLRRLEKDEVISLQMANTDSEITFLKPREDEITINPIAKTIKQQHQLKHEQIAAVLNYVQNDLVCRSQQLLTYFGEKTHIKCGKCSVCLDKNAAISPLNKLRITSLILDVLKVEGLSSRQLLQRIKCSEQALLQSISELIETKQIKVTEANTYTII
jgi:ATP-dependent DNA helicase RecQ